MSTRKLVDASLRFAQSRKAGEHVPHRTYEEQKVIVAREIEKTLDIFCPQDFDCEPSEVILYPGLENDVTPFSILDEIVVHTEDGADRIFITNDLVQAVENCFGAYFDVTEQNDESGVFDRQEEALKAGARIAVSAWLFDKLNPVKMWAKQQENPTYLTALQAGILPKGEGSVEDAIDIARFKVIGAAARNGFQDDQRYGTFQATYLAMFEEQLLGSDHTYITEDPRFGLRFALAYACSDDDAIEMLDRMNNVNRVIEKYL